MPYNELEAMKLLDEGKISDEEIKFLSRLRNGVAVSDVEDDENFKSLEERGFVQRIPLSHPRTSVMVDAAIPTEMGVTTLNLFDKRFRENTNAAPDANTAPDVDPKMVIHPTDEEARLVPSLDKKPLPENEKNVAPPAGFEEAKKDPEVATGSKEVIEAEPTDEKPAKKL